MWKGELIMKKLMYVPLVAMLAACNLAAERAIAAPVEPSPIPPTPTEPLPPTEEPTPTPTPLPTRTPRPTRTPAPVWDPADIGDVEASLSEHGYRRFPFTNKDGTSGFTWVDKSPYERVTTWEDGTIRVQILNDGTAGERAARLEQHLALLDEVLPAGFMAQLRDEHLGYNRAISASVTGEPNQLFAYGDEWQTVVGEYNATGSELGGYNVKFSLWWWQSTCPAQYSYCYYSDFPGLEFVGDSSFVFHTIMIWLPEEGGPSSPSA
jgi:hypothetical protein